MPLIQPTKLKSSLLFEANAINSSEILVFQLDFAGLNTDLFVKFPQSSKSHSPVSVWDKFPNIICI